MNESIKQSRFGVFPYCNELSEPDTYSEEEEQRYFNRPTDFSEVLLKRLDLCLLRLEQLEIRVHKLEHGLAKMQFKR